MSEFSRRTFLARSSLLAAVTTVASLVPGATRFLEAAQTEAPEIDSFGADSTAASASELSAGTADSGAPLIAHVRDVSTGEIGVFNGTREIIVRDPQLARRILRAAG